MAAATKKSKKRSAANSRRQPDVFTLYLDRSLGRHTVADHLRQCGIAVEAHDDHLPPDAPDEIWISLVAENKWLALTKDKNIRFRHAELKAVRDHKARVLVLRVKNATGLEMAKLVDNSINRIQKFARKNKPPFVAGLSRGGKITKYDISRRSLR